MLEENQSKNEQDRERLEQESFDYTLKGKAEEVGLIAKGSAANPDGDFHRKEKKKEKDFTDLILKTLLDEVSEIMFETKSLLMERKKNLEALEQATKIMKDWDSDQAKVFLTSHGVNVKGMSENDLADTVRNKIRDFVERDHFLAGRIAEKVQYIKSKMNGPQIDATLADEFIQMLKDSEAQGIEADRAIVEAKVVLGLSDEVLTKLDTTQLESDLDKVLLPEGNAQETYSNDRRNNSISFASGENDPFTEVVERISNPFNAVAKGLEIETLETKNDLSQEAVLKTTKVEVPTL